MFVFFVASFCSNKLDIFTDQSYTLYEHFSHFRSPRKKMATKKTVKTNHSFELSLIGQELYKALMAGKKAAEGAYQGSSSLLT